MKENLAKQANYAIYSAMCKKMMKIPEKFVDFDIKVFKRTKSYYKIFRENEEKINRAS